MSRLIPTLISGMVLSLAGMMSHAAEQARDLMDSIVSTLPPAEKVVNLSGGRGIPLQLDPPVSGQSGTLVFWLRPLWNENDGRSHVLLSGRWDGTDAYMAVSYGWWEPTGKGRLYFIVNNQEQMHCSAPYRFEPNQWVMVTARWEGGVDGFCSLHVGMAKLAEHRAAFPGNYQSRHWHLGSDAGATNPAGRASDFEIGQLHLYASALSEREIRALYQHEETKRFGRSSAEWAWMDSVLAMPEPQLPTAQDVVQETRVMFDEDLHWALSREHAERILQNLKTAGFNVYVPCVWHGQGTHYPSDITAADSRLLPVMAQGHDPLAYLIDRAHQLGIEVHPWFTVTRREWSRNPEWFPEGTPDNAYDVHNPQFREFIVSLVADVARRYAVDGINLDYIRAMGICLSDRCEQDYRRQTGHSLTQDYYLRAVSSSARQRIEVWQDGAVADIVERIAREIRRIDPAIVISIDGHPKPQDEQRPLEGRNEIAWANQGWVDVIFAMDYRRRFDAAALENVRNGLQPPAQLIPLLGNFDRIDSRPESRPAALIEKYVEYLRRQSPGSGVAFYIYAMMDDAQRDRLGSVVFRGKAVPAWRSRSEFPGPKHAAPDGSLHQKADRS